MTGLNCPDSISALKCLTISWVCPGMGNITFLPPNSGVMSASTGFLRKGTQLRRELDTAHFQQSLAGAERALADRTEDYVVGVLVPGEVLCWVVDDSVGAQGP
jgi:hypothetical protein